MTSSQLNLTPNDESIASLFGSLGPAAGDRAKATIIIRPERPMLREIRIAAGINLGVKGCSRQ
jgi:hypothetical protein